MILNRISLSFIEKSNIVNCQFKQFDIKKILCLVYWEIYTKNLHRYDMRHDLKNDLFTIFVKDP